MSCYELPVRHCEVLSRDVLSLVLPVSTSVSPSILFLLHLSTSVSTSVFLLSLLCSNNFLCISLSPPLSVSALSLPMWVLTLAVVSILGWGKDVLRFPCIFVKGDVVLHFF